MGADKHIGNVICDDTSVTDYTICSLAIFADIQDFYIDIFDPLLSDKHNTMIVDVALKHENVHELPVMYDNIVNASPKQCYVDNTKYEAWRWIFLSFLPCNAGVRQVENLSPLLFSIYLNDFQSYVSNNFPVYLFFQIM